MLNVPKQLNQLALATAMVGMLCQSPVAGQTLRPLETETGALLPSGTTQISLGTSYLRNSRFPAFTKPGVVRSQDLFSAPELEIRIGAGDWVEIQLRYEFLYLDEGRGDGTSHDQFGGGDAEFFTKIRFVRESGIGSPRSERAFGVKLPNANSANLLGTDETDFEIAILGSKDFGPVAAHVNLGLQILGNPGQLRGEVEPAAGQDDPFIYSLALVSQPLKLQPDSPYSIRGLLSIDGKEASRFDNNRTSVSAGFQVTRAAWTLYAGASAGLSGAAEDVGARFGLTYAFELERLRGLFD